MVALAAAIMHLRTGRLQFRRQGTTSWTTHLVQTSPVSGYLLMDLPVKNGIYEWRLALRIEPLAEHLRPVPARRRASC